MTFAFFDTLYMCRWSKIVSDATVLCVELAPCASDYKIACASKIVKSTSSVAHHPGKTTNNNRYSTTFLPPEIRNAIESV